MPHIKNILLLLAMYLVSLYVKLEPTPSWRGEDNTISYMLLAFIIVLFAGYLEELAERGKRKSKKEEIL